LDGIDHSSSMFVCESIHLTLLKVEFIEKIVTYFLTNWHVETKNLFPTDADTTVNIVKPYLGFMKFRKRTYITALENEVNK